MSDSHAVRWAQRMLKRINEPAYGRWHWTDGEFITLCQIVIPCTEITPIPDTDDEANCVTCRHCRRILDRQKE